MKFRINFEHVDGTEDSFIAEGDTIEDIREQADAGVRNRNGQNPWSEEIT